MKQIKAFFSSAFITLIILCLVIVGVYSAIKIDNTAGYVSNSTDEIVYDGILNFNLFGASLQINLNFIVKIIKAIGLWCAFFI
ncbi:MAG: hypothetical protein II366_01135 [Clostridia bacterium]|nr:hypothetical protein [Clostridia bacterium]